MMPDLRPALRQTGGRRVSGQVLNPRIVDNKVDQNPQKIIRATCVLTPLSQRKLALKQEGERAWKWWDASSDVWFELGWFILPDNDDRIKYEVMTQADWRQARVAVYEFVERPR